VTSGPLQITLAGHYTLDSTPLLTPSANSQDASLPVTILLGRITAFRLYLRGPIVYFSQPIHEYCQPTETL
jgi:hypothetical protein